MTKRSSTIKVKIYRVHRRKENPGYAYVIESRSITNSVTKTVRLYLRVSQNVFAGTLNLAQLQLRVSRTEQSR